MGVMATDRRGRERAYAAILFAATAALLFLFLPSHASGASQPLFTPSENAAGRYDTMVLRDLGKRTAAVVSMVAVDGSFTAAELWRSGKGKLDVRKVKWLVADVNADGLADGVALIDLGRGQSRFVIYLNGGDKAKPKTAWTSKKGAFVWSRAKLAVGDVNGDGLDDVVALYDRGKAGTALNCFISSGTRFTMSTGWKAPRASFSWANAQLAAGDFTKDGKDDALVLCKRSASSSQLLVLVSGGTTFTETEFWSGDYAATGVQLAAGDVNSDGIFDAVCLAPGSGGTARLDVFLSSGTAFSGPTTWYDGSALPGSGGRLVVGDLTGDGRADALVARSTGASSSSLVACVSTGSAFTPATWWSGPWRYAGLRVGCAPSPGLIISDQAKVADVATLDALSGVAADGTLTFDQETTQLQQLEPGDVLISQPDAANPQGIFRKVSSVSGSGGGVTVTTTQAALDDVVQFGEVGFFKRVRPGDLSQADVTQPGVRLTSKRGDPLITFSISTELKVPVGDHTETAVKLSGSLSLDPVAYFSYDVGWTGLHSLSYTQIMNATSDLDVEVMETFSADLEKTLFEAPLGTIAVVVPPGVPIWVTPVFKLYVGAGGSVSAGVTAGVTETVTSTVTLGYWSGSFHAPTFSSSRDTTWRKPKLFGALTLEAYAGAGLEFLLYSVAGPYASLEAGLILEAATNRTPWWELSANVDFEIGVTLDLRLAELTASYPFNLFKYRIDWARTPYGQRGVSGKVTAADSGAPLSGATVKLHEGAGSPAGIVWATTTTAADGTYSFAGPPVGDYTVTAAKSGYLSGWRDTSVVAQVVTEGQDIALSPGTAPGGGLSGVVKNAATNAPLAGASVEVRQGADNPFGSLLATTTSTANGSYEFWDIPVGKCTVVARKTGFDANSRTAEVDSGASTVGHDILLTPAGQFASMRSALDGYIRWARAFDDQANATFEFWFRPTEAGGMEYGNDIAQISRDYTDWMGGGPARWPIMQIQFSGSPNAPTLDFWINENVGDESGAIHRLTSTTQLQLGLWCHIAVQYGSQGMKLFVNGHLEASNKYTKRAAANQGATAGGWFSLGDNHTVGSGYMSALGDYRGLRVSNVERYPNDFLPQDLPREDGYTRIHDPLAGATNGVNVNFVPTPVTP
jgi:hypothetical protein